MDIWFNQFPLSASLPPLKRSTSEESGYISADSDMVIDTLKNFTIQSLDIFQNLDDISQKSDYSWCRAKQSKLEKARSVETILPNYDTIRDYEIPTEEKSSTEIMNDQNITHSNTERPAGLILDFESLPDILSQTDIGDTKSSNEHQNVPKSRKTSPVAGSSKKGENTEEKNVVVPSGRW